MDKEPRLLSASLAASYCSVSVRTWHRCRASGKIPLPVRVGGLVRWKREELDQWIDFGCPELERFLELKKEADR
jgi:excisionase family DNA binding protein